MSTAVPSTSSTPRSTRTRRPRVADRDRQRSSTAVVPPSDNSSRYPSSSDRSRATRRSTRSGTSPGPTSPTVPASPVLPPTISSSATAVARSSSGYRSPQATFRPIPAATAARWVGPGACQPDAAPTPGGHSASARMPASLRSTAEPSPGQTRSLGHFRRGSTPVRAATASDAARASTMVVSPATAAGGRSNTVSSSEPSTGASHTRPRRPRPASWWSATTTIPSGSPARTSSSTSALVEPVDASHRTSANRQPASADRARRPRSTASGWRDGGSTLIAAQ